jgi:hypothetical protein
MPSTKRTIGKIGIIGTFILSGLFMATSAEANDRNRGERINAQLDFLAFVAALSGDHYLAYRLDRRGDRIERRHARRGDPRVPFWRGTQRPHHHHFSGRGHSDLRNRTHHPKRLDRRPRHSRNHRRHERRNR